MLLVSDGRLRKSEKVVDPALRRRLVKGAIVVLGSKGLCVLKVV